MYVIGKEATIEAANAAGRHLENLYAYPSDTDCVWLGWDGSNLTALLNDQVRMALVFTLERELKLHTEKNGALLEVPDNTVFSVVASITGKGPMWWERYGHNYVRRTTLNYKGFA